jgi:hypothetical protein
MLTDSDQLFVKIAMDNKYITEWHLKKAVKRRDSYLTRGIKKKLGNILLELGFLTKMQYQAIENAQRYREMRDRDKQIGKIIVKSEYASQKQVDEALREQKHRYGETGETTPVGNVMIELGHLSEEHLIAAKKIFKIREQQKKRLKKSKKRRTPSH